MSALMTAPLTLLRSGDGWLLQLCGDWSLTAMPGIEAHLHGLPAELHGALTCDWAQTRTPGIGPAWALLRRLADAGGVSQQLNIRHEGNPPHFLELLRKLHVERHAAYATRTPP